MSALVNQIEPILQNRIKADPGLLKKHFGLDSFRRGQSEIIRDVLEGHDVLAVLPTGGGKSLCYQYPAVASEKLVLVVSPLIALMKDQVGALTRLGMRAGCLHSGQTLEEQRQIFRDLKVPGPYVLYLSPERTQKDGFQAWLKTAPVALFAIDEAHCVSQWGHDFRSEYSQLRILKHTRPEVPVLALTASATPFVLSDIAKQIELKAPKKHVHGFYRSNLYYQVETCADEDEKMDFVRQGLKQTPEGRVLIYCGTRKITEEIAEALEREFEGVSFYHAGMTPKRRHETQEDYGSGKTRILVATNAFGMGIDHPDVRLVIHYQMPANIDSLYQEMGRAGRDGKPSTCLLLYAKKDKGLQSFFIQRSEAAAAIQSSRWRALENLVEYAEGSECRHAEILTYYKDSQRLERCGHCDVCASVTSRRIDRPPARVVVSLKKVKARKKSGSGSADEARPLSADENRIFEILRLWRKEKAKELDVPAFVVFSDRTLRELAKHQPRSHEDLVKIYGISDTKAERFGADLLQGPLS